VNGLGDYDELLSIVRDHRKSLSRSFCRHSSIPFSRYPQHNNSDWVDDETTDSNSGRRYIPVRK